MCIWVPQFRGPAPPPPMVWVPGFPPLRGYVISGWVASCISGYVISLPSTEHRGNARKDRGQGRAGQVREPRDARRETLKNSDGFLWYFSV